MGLGSRLAHMGKVTSQISAHVSIPAVLTPSVVGQAADASVPVSPHQGRHCLPPSMAPPPPCGVVPRRLSLHGLSRSPALRIGQLDTCRCHPGVGPQASSRPEEIDFESSSVRYLIQYMNRSLEMCSGHQLATTRENLGAACKSSYGTSKSLGTGELGSMSVASDEIHSIDAEAA